MTKNITIDSKDYPAYDWQEAQLQNAGYPPAAQAVHEAEMAKRGEVILGLGEVFFRCDTTYSAGTRFTVKGEKKDYVIKTGHDRKHVASLA